MLVGILLILVGIPADATTNGREMAVSLMERHGAELILASPENSEPGSLESWWTTFNDPALSAAIEQGLLKNSNLQVAESRIKIAKSQSLREGGALLPSASFDLSGNMAPTDSLGFGAFSAVIPDYSGFFDGLVDILPAGVELPSLEDTDEASPALYGSGQAVFQVGMSLDLWGRQFLKWQAARKDVLASSNSRDAQALALSAMIADAYFDVVSLSKQARSVQAQIQGNKELLTLVQLRYEGGESTGLDVLQQQQLLLATEALLPTVLAGRRQVFEQLKVLCMGCVSDLESMEQASLPEVEEVGDMDVLGLVDRRPELLGAIATTNAAKSRRISAQLGFLPSLNVSAQFGWQGFYYDSFDQQQVWGAGAALTVPLFQGGRILSNLQASRANEHIAHRNLESAVLRVLQEVENAKEAQEQQKELLSLRAQQVNAAKQAYEMARQYYLEGLVDYTTVLTSMTIHQQAELSFIETKRGALRAFVQGQVAMSGATLFPRPGTGLDRGIKK
jgi:multidrug efflux system outer membrane protein